MTFRTMSFVLAPPSSLGMVGELLIPTLLPMVKAPLGSRLQRLPWGGFEEPPPVTDSDSCTQDSFRAV